MCVHCSRKAFFQQKFEQVLDKDLVCIKRSSSYKSDLICIQMIKPNILSAFFDYFCVFKIKSNLFECVKKIREKKKERPTFHVYEPGEEGRRYEVGDGRPVGEHEQRRRVPAVHVHPHLQTATCRMRT